MAKILFTPEQLYKVYNLSYTISESRGKERQNILNDIVIESLKNNSSYEGCEFKSEVRIPGDKLLWGKYFPVDVCVYKDNQLIEIILIKAPSSNIKQNRINSLNSINSDVTRLSKLSEEGLSKISLINFLPKESPFFKRDESIKNFESNTPFFLTKSGAPYRFDIDEIYVTFNINGLKNCSDKNDVKLLFNSSNPINIISISEENYKKLS